MGKKSSDAPDGAFIVSTGSHILWFDGARLGVECTTFGNKSKAVYPLTQISGVHVSPPQFGQLLGRFQIMLPGTVATRGRQGVLKTSNDPLVVMFNKKRLAEVEELARRIQAVQTGQGRPQSPGAPAGGGLAAQLAQLQQLHAAGALTDVEFAAAKGRLLGTS